MPDKNKLILGTNDDTYIAGDDAGNIVLQHEAGQRVSLTSDAILPAGNETLDLGGPENKFRDLYLSSNSLYVGNTKITSDPATGALSTAVSDGAGGFSAPAAIGGGGGIEQLITDGEDLYSIHNSGYHAIRTRIGVEKIYNYLIDNNMSSSFFNIKLELHNVFDPTTGGLLPSELWFTNSTFMFAAAGTFSAAVRAIPGTLGPDNEFRIDGNMSSIDIATWSGQIGNLNNFTPKESTIDGFPVLYNIPTRSFGGNPEGDWLPYTDWAVLPPNPADRLDNLGITLFSAVDNTPWPVIAPRVIITPLV